MRSSISALGREGARWGAAFLGICLWGAYPFVFPFEKHARLVAMCSEQQIVEHFNTCSNDALPVDALIIVPGIAIVLFYFFMRFAFTIYAPPSYDRLLDWRFAGSTGGAEAFPFLQIVSALGFGWSSFRLAGLPLDLSHWYLLAYWAAWILWFASAAIVSLPKRGQLQQDL